MGPKSKEEKIEAEIRRLSKLDGNKICADCPEKMPNYVNLTFKTFVCTNCAGIHRSLNYNGNPTKVKGISMSSFTMEEANELARGGNNANNAVFMARYVHGRDQSLPNSSEKEKMSVFIRQKYENKRWFNDGTNSNNDWGHNNNNNNINDNSNNSRSFSYNYGGGQSSDNSLFNHQQSNTSTTLFNQNSLESSGIGIKKPMSIAAKPVGLDLLDMAGSSSLTSPTSQQSKLFNAPMNTNNNNSNNNNNNNINSFDTFSSTSNFDPFSSSSSSSFSGFENGGTSFSFSSSSSKPTFDPYGSNSASGSTINSKPFDPFNNSSSFSQQLQQSPSNFDAFGSSGQNPSLPFNAFGSSSSNVQSNFDPFSQATNQPLPTFGQPEAQAQQSVSFMNNIGTPVSIAPDKGAPMPLTANFSAFDDLVISESTPRLHQVPQLSPLNPFEHSKAVQNPSSNSFVAPQSGTNMFAQQKFPQPIQQQQEQQSSQSLPMPPQQNQFLGYPMQSQQKSVFPIPQLQQPSHSFPVQQPQGFQIQQLQHYHQQQQQHPQGFLFPQQSQLLPMPQQAQVFPLPQQQQPPSQLGFIMSQQQPSQGFPLQQFQGFSMSQNQQGLLAAPQQQSQGNVVQQTQSFLSQGNILEMSSHDSFSAMTSIAFDNVSLPPPASRPSISNSISNNDSMSNTFPFTEQQNNPYSSSTDITTNNALPASTAAANPFDLF